MEGGRNYNPPQWLSVFLRASFYEPCHSCERYKNERKKKSLFCIDCLGDALCASCDTHLHKGHKILNVCKASGHAAIPIEVIGKYIYVSQIKQFKINSKPIVFLNSRLGEEPKKGGSSLIKCEKCGWQLIDGSPSDKFCSIACKLCPDHLIVSVNFVAPRKTNQPSSASNIGVVGHGEQNAPLIVLDQGKKRVKPSKTGACASTSKKACASTAKKRKQSITRNVNVIVNHGELLAPPNNQLPSTTTNHGQVHASPSNQPPSTTTIVTYSYRPSNRRRKQKHPQRAPLK